MKVSGQLHAPADIPWEINAVKIRQEAGWAPERGSMLLKKEQLLTPAGIRGLDSSARTLDAIATTRCKYYLGTSILQTSAMQCRGVNGPLTNFKSFS
jgi:hypothetical protein